jgi:nucleotide-binding universal stress UspA family protein
MQRIVVGFDATAAARSAARWALGVSRLSGAEVILVHGSRVGDVLADGEQERVRSAAEQLMGSAGQAAGSPSYIDRAGDPTEVLADVSRELDADLVVIGRAPHGQGEDHATRTAMAHELVHRAEAAVATVPLDIAPVDASTRWVLGFDGSQGGQQALDFVRQVASSPEAVMPVLVADPAADTFPHPEEESWSYPGEGDVRAQLSAAGIDELHVEPGDPAEVLPRIAMGQGNAVVVAGTRRGLIGRLGYSGKTANQLLEIDDVAVIVVAHGAVHPLDGPITTPSGADGEPALDAEMPEPGSGERRLLATDSHEDAGEAVRSAERAGGDASRLHVSGVSRPDSNADVQRNDHANLAEVTRPTARNAVIGAIGLAAVLVIIALIVGADTMVVVMLGIGGLIVGGVLGGFSGLYGSVPMNRDVIDLRGQEQEGTIVVVEDDHPGAAGDTEDVGGLGYVEEHDQRRRSGRH